MDQGFAGGERQRHQPSHGERLNVQREHPEVAGVADRGGNHARARSALADQLGGTGGHVRAEPEAAVYGEHRVRRPPCLRGRARADQPTADALGDHRQSLHAVGRAPAEIPLHQHPRLVGGLRLAGAQPAQHLEDERPLVRGVDPDELRFVQRHSPATSIS
jgi:hypothetical protein